MSHPPIPTPLRRPTLPLAVAAFLGTILHPHPGETAVNDVFPGDFVALAPGSAVMTVYAFQRRQEGTYVQGRREGGLVLDSQIVAVRLAYAMEIGGLRMGPVIAAGLARGEAKGSVPTGMNHSADGLIDLRLGWGVWPIADTKKGRWVGIGGMVIPPSGEYHPNDLVNTGENRWRGVVSVGWVERVTPEITTDLIYEHAWYGENGRYAGHYTLEQHPTDSVTGYLRYAVTPQVRPYVGGQLNWGGATTVNGLPFSGAVNGSRGMLGVDWRVTPTTRVDLRWSRDLEVESGLRSTGEWVIRLLQAF